MRTFILSCLLSAPAFIFGQSALKLECDTMDIGMVRIEIDSLGRQLNSTYRTVEFPFTNTGNEPLIISQVIGNGNGSAELPQAPVLPGKKGTIIVTINRFRYSKIIQKDGSHAFITPMIVEGNFKGERQTLYVKGLTIQTRKKK